MTYGIKEAHDELLSELEDMREKYAEVCETSAMLRADMAAARERQAKLRDENAKLRKLVRSFHSGMLFMLETGMWATDPKWLEEQMKKLGIEVDG